MEQLISVLLLTLKYHCLLCYYFLVFYCADPTPSEPVKQNIPPSTAAEKLFVTSAVAEQLREDPAEQGAANKDEQDNFLIESVDADDEMSQNTVTDFATLNSPHFKNGNWLEERRGHGEAKRAEPRQDRRELRSSNKEAAHRAEKTLETNSAKASQCSCAIALSAPKAHVPRKEKPKGGCEVHVDKPRTDPAAGKADKEVGELRALGHCCIPVGCCSSELPFLSSFLVKTSERSEENKPLCYQIVLVIAFSSKGFLFPISLMC